MKEIKNKVISYIIMLSTFGLIVPESIKKKYAFEEGSLKEKNMKINNVLWSIIYFFFFIMIAAACFDSFFINRAVMVKYLTRTALLLLVYILISDGVVSLIKDSDKVKNAEGSE